MKYTIGLDIGGTKIAGAAYDEAGVEVARAKLPTPKTYEALLENCRKIVETLELEIGTAISVGACAPYADDKTCANVPSLIGKPFAQDMSKTLARPVALANDANCAALAEALEGAGKGFRAVFGLIIGTGVGGGFVLDGRVLTGLNGLACEVGHLPLPFYEEGDGRRVLCGCGQHGCIEKLVAGEGLARLYEDMAGTFTMSRQVTEQANAGNPDALRVLERYYEVVAKAMVAIIHMFDPDIITVSGGLSGLPKLYDEVPRRWGKYTIAKKPRTQFVMATHGPMAGLRGAALLGEHHT